MQTPITKSRTPQAFSYSELSGVGLLGVEVLVGLGLSGRQARVYLALLRTGVANAKAISSASQVNRQDIHRVINSLQLIGLINRRLTHPSTFQAAPIDEVLKVLVEQKTTELVALKNSSKQLTKKYSQTVQAQFFSETPCLGILSEGDKGKKHQVAIQNSRFSVDAVLSYLQFRQLTTLFETQLKSALKTGVVMRVVTEKPRNGSLPDWISNHKGFDLRVLENPPAASFTIFDSAQAAIAVSSEVKFTKGPHLWTSNPGLIALCQMFFGNVWMQGLKQ